MIFKNHKSERKKEHIEFNFTGSSFHLNCELRPPIGGKIHHGGKINGGMGGQQRRALSNINQNVIGSSTLAPVVYRNGPLIQKNTFSTKNPPIPVHQPITRKLAHQIASSTQKKPHIEETKQVQSIPNASVLVVEEVDDDDDDEDYDDDYYDGIISDDDDDYKTTTDEYPVPLSVHQTEALLEEIDQMDDESVKDIDFNDKKNPLAVVEYVDDIYCYYRKSELSGCVQPNYMEQQFDINERMRAVLIDWLIEVHYKFELMEETLYLTINIIDRFLALKTVIRKKLQLVGVTAMLIACKYEEVYVPVVEDFILISDKAYSRKEVLDMESLIINTLEFKLSVPTPYVFMRRFLKAAESDNKLELLSYLIMELCLVEYEMLRFPPSQLAAAAIFTAQCSINGGSSSSSSTSSNQWWWSKTFEKYTNYTKEQLLECAKLMVDFHKKSGTGRLIAVHKKYSTVKYGFAAKSSIPALFLMDITTTITRKR